MCKFSSAADPDCEMIMELIALQLEAAMIQFKDLERMSIHIPLPIAVCLPKNTS
jgi:hypothetical protein